MDVDSYPYVVTWQEDGRPSLRGQDNLTISVPAAPLPGEHIAKVFISSLAVHAGDILCRVSDSPLFEVNICLRCTDHADRWKIVGEWYSLVYFIPGCRPMEKRRYNLV